MSELVDPTLIEQIVGIKRHPTDHYGRAISRSQTVYVLHSSACLARHAESLLDLRLCEYSQVLDNGISQLDWAGLEDRPVLLGIVLDTERGIPRLSPMIG